MSTNHSSPNMTLPGHRRLSGDHLTQVAMPLGGIGAGCVCFNGHGGFQDFSIKGVPDLTALPDGHTTVAGAFALVHVKGGATRLLEGPLPLGKIYDQGLQSQGYRKSGAEGLPRFDRCEFVGGYPFGRVELADASVPLAVTITAWSPFVPLDDVASGMPAAMAEYAFTNTASEPVEVEFSFHMTHPAVGVEGWAGTRSSVIPGRGFAMGSTDALASPSYGTAAVGVVGESPAVKAAWFRGGWFDSVSALWREVSTGTFRPNAGSGAPGRDGMNGGSLLVAARLAPGESRTIPVVITWHFPNQTTAQGQPACAPGECAPGECAPPAAPRWKPFYTTQWADATAVLTDAVERYGELRARTAAFHDALFGSTLPDEVIDAVSANLGILKSPTVLRQSAGTIWAWEGCFGTVGCCHGSCTHVWNYAQAMPHLFPALERTLREQEYVQSMDERGHVNFRAALPDGPTTHDFHAAADGQLGGPMKLFRDWHICGDSDWLRGMYPAARRSTDYCIATWDPDELGALIEPHHNTYDIEFWGADGMCTSVYVGALAAMAAMAGALGEAEDASRYRALADRGARYLDDTLFNGEYFEQKVEWDSLRDRSFAESVAGDAAPDDEIGHLLRAEGPKYQYGSGCLSDGVIGAWMALLYGIDSPQTRANVRANLAAIYRNNFREDLWDHVCTQRPGYALGHEPGLILCTWPNGGKPTLPFVYSDEVWTGIEYQVASHLIAEGTVDEGLAVVRAARSRYDGRARNPWNEYECGSYYARAMASYALLQALSGVRYSAVTRTLHVAPRIEAERFRCFFSAASGWGTVSINGSAVTVSMAEGLLDVRTVVVGQDGEAREVAVDRVARPGEDVVAAVG